MHLIKPKYPSKDIAATPTAPFQQINHAPNELLDLAMHQVIDRREWCKYRGYQQRKGWFAAWLYDRICFKDDDQTKVEALSWEVNDHIPVEACRIPDIAQAEGPQSISS